MNTPPGRKSPASKEPITYSLRAASGDSGRYYLDIAGFTDRVLTELRDRAGPLLAAFMEQPHRPGLPDQGLEQAALSLLTGAVLWKVHGSSLGVLPPRVVDLFAGLAKARAAGRISKPAAEVLRAFFGALAPPRPGKPVQAPLRRDSFGLLISWLTASGEYEEEAGLLSAWQEYLVGLPEEKAAPILEMIPPLADWFEQASLEALGTYTAHVEKFLKKGLSRHRWREDAIFCGRQRIEYHLNMVAGEVLNRLLRQDFLAAGRRIVLAPPCLRAKPEKECQAVQTETGGLCRACTPDCRVHQLTLLGRKHDFSVCLMPDDFAVYRGSGGSSSQPIPGLLGISCVLTNAPGGWRAWRLGIPAQGLLLEYCGCSYHWDAKGFPTDINFSELGRLLALPKSSD